MSFGVIEMLCAALRASARVERKSDGEVSKNGVLALSVNRMKYLCVAGCAKEITGNKRIIKNFFTSMAVIGYSEFIFEAVQDNLTINCILCIDAVDLFIKHAHVCAVNFLFKDTVYMGNKIILQHRHS